MPDARYAVVYADFAQFYLCDLEAHQSWMHVGGTADPRLPAAGWTREASDMHRIGVEPHSISVGTARIDVVETVLQILPDAPGEVRPDAGHVVEADLEVVSGSVSLLGCTQDPGPEDRIGLPAGRYRVRVSYIPSGPPDGSSDVEPGAHFRYLLDMWPASESSALAVLRQGPFPWAG